MAERQGEPYCCQNARKNAKTNEGVCADVKRTKKSTRNSSCRLKLGQSKQKRMTVSESWSKNPKPTMRPTKNFKPAPIINEANFYTKSKLGKLVKKNSPQLTRKRKLFFTK